MYEGCARFGGHRFLSLTKATTPVWTVLGPMAVWRSTHDPGQRSRPGGSVASAMFDQECQVGQINQSAKRWTSMTTAALALC